MARMIAVEFARASDQKIAESACDSFVYTIYTRGNSALFKQARMMTQSEVVTVRLTPDLKAKLDSLAASTQRSKSWLAAEAIAQYVEQESWQIQNIETAVALADSPEAEWIEGTAVETWLDSWGTDTEHVAPCA
jgi:RHH-type transcriptional regulator, rel operon repressor / antitoxin RelB